MPLYKMTSPSGKAYIGITTGKIIDRMHRHRATANAGSQYSIHNALRKYGFKSFTVEVLDDETDIDKLNKLEVLAIAKHGTLYPLGYNLTTGGDGVAGPHSAKRTKRFWEEVGPEKKTAMVEKMKSSSREFWQNVSEEELAAMRVRGAEGARKWWMDATPAQRAQREDRVREKRLARSDEEKARLAKISSKAASTHWANQTPEEKAAHSIVRAAASKLTWANLTSEQRKERGRRMSEGKSRARSIRVSSS